MRPEMPSLVPHATTISTQEMDLVDLTLHNYPDKLPPHLTVLVLTAFPRYELVNIVNITPTNPHGVNGKYGVYYEIVGLPYGQSSVKVEHTHLTETMDRLVQVPDRQIAAVISNACIPAVGYVRHTSTENMRNGALLDAIAAKYALLMKQQ
ncbi:hypothetical protein HZB01_00825 [Candidatus Woesearchaeota archaeon]|nr:hypothetical protein [Candidatus Woesearchaeota archaeon]